ncbi:hypothetical protein U2F10_21910 [Leptothoe sp. EHU-05/26/07-4]
MVGYCPRQYAIPIHSYSHVIAAAGLAIGAIGLTADFAQLAQALNVPLPQVEQVQVEQIESE